MKEDLTSTEGWTAEELAVLDQRVKKVTDEELYRLMFDISREVFPVCIRDSYVPGYPNRPAKAATVYAQALIDEMGYHERFAKTVREEAIRNHNRYKTHLATCPDHSVASAQVPS